MGAKTELEHIDRYFEKNWMDEDFPSDLIWKELIQRDELLAALKELVSCISETRGKNANDALFKANEAIAKADLTQ